MSTDLVLSRETRTELKEIAADAFGSRLLSQEIRSAEAAHFVAMVGAELGFSPIQSLQNIYVIKGKAVLSAAALQALVVRSASCKYFMMVESTPQRAVYETQRDGHPKPTTLTYAIEDARTAGLTNNPTWKSHPSAMLRARCAAALARAVYPDIVMGLYEEDEGREIAGEGRVIEATEPVRVEPARTEPAESPAVAVIAAYKRKISEAPTYEALCKIAAELGEEHSEVKSSGPLRAHYSARSRELKPLLQRAFEELAKAGNAPHVDQIEEQWRQQLAESEWERWRTACAEKRKGLGVAQ